MMVVVEVVVEVALLVTMVVAAKECVEEVMY